MKSGGPWNLRGLRPEAREAAREAARRSGMSVGEWLNTVIRPAEEDDEDSWWGAAAGYEPDRQRHRPSRRDEWEREGDRDWERDRYRAPPRRDSRAPPDDRWRQSPRHDEVERNRPRDRGWHSRDDEWERWRDREGNRRDRFDEDGDELFVRREGRPYRNPGSRPGGPYRTEDENRDVPNREPRHHEEDAALRAESERDASIDKAIAEIEARQRVLDREAPPERSFSEREPQPLPPRPEQSYAHSAPAHSAEPPLDLGGLEQQLRQITTKIEALRPSAELGSAINSLHAELAAIGRSLTEALPRRALESLEIEIKALAERIDHSRQSGVDGAALAGIERGLAEVREALSRLTPAEGLIGFDEAVGALAKKVDAIVARDDPATLQQLEAAIGALRGIVAHVASNDTLTKVAEDVRMLAAKVDGLAANAPALSSLEVRIDKLTGAINASTEAGHAVPRELEKLLSGLIEKLEWVQLTHTDHSALAHLEDRIATLVKRLDVSDARLGMLEGVERGLSDLLVYIERLRGDGVAVGTPRQVTVDEIEQEVAEIKETERRTQDSLEDVQGTVEQVVDRLATIENDMRGDKGKHSKPPPAEVLQAPPLAEVPEGPADEVLAPVEVAAAEAAPKPRSEPAPSRPAAARQPIDPTLPPDHPLEPGSAASRPRPQPSAADRIAASEAAVGLKPPVIADPGGGKPDFIAAARRAAKAAAVAAPANQPNAAFGVRVSAPAKKLSERLRTVMVAGAVVVIIVGGFHIVSRLFADGGSNAPPQTHTEAPRLLKEPLHLPSEPAEAPTPAPRLETEPPATPVEPPHVQAEPPSPRAPPEQKSHAEPADGSVLAPSGPPSDTSGPTPGAAPGQQSLLNGNKKVPDAAAMAATGQQIDVTGSLPPASAQHSAATATAGADKLPIAIGSPALRAAANAGDPSAAYEVASRFAEGRLVPANNEEAARWFDVAARKGLAPAQFRLGTLYEKGIGVKKNLAMARDLYRAAADKGHGKAMHNLAVLYAEGVDGSPDYRMAAQWFRKAADHGVADSQYNLAVLYARGVGVEQNFAESYKWFCLAAKDGDQDAAQKRDEVAAHLDQRALNAARLATDSWAPVPQPADAVTVKAAWDAPPAGAAPKVKARSVKAPQQIAPAAAN